jgi:hypothetical protein
MPKNQKNYLLPPTGSIPGLRKSLHLAREQISRVQIDGTLSLTLFDVQVFPRYSEISRVRSGFWGEKYLCTLE